MVQILPVLPGECVLRMSDDLGEGKGTILSGVNSYKAVRSLAMLSRPK